MPHRQNNSKIQSENHVDAKSILITNMPELSISWFGAGAINKNRRGYTMNPDIL